MSTPNSIKKENKLSERADIPLKVRHYGDSRNSQRLAFETTVLQIALEVVFPFAQNLIDRQT